MSARSDQRRDNTMRAAIRMLANQGLNNSQIVKRLPEMIGHKVSYAHVKRVAEQERNATKQEDQV